MTFLHEIHEALVTLGLDCKSLTFEQNDEYQPLAVRSLEKQFPQIIALLLPMHFSGDSSR